MKKIFVLFLAFVDLICVRPASAQTLVFHLPDGAVSEVSMPCTFTFSSSGDKLIIDGTGNHIELQRDRILAMTYRPNRGDANNDMKVDVADLATIINIMAGREDGKDPEPGPTPDPDPTPAPDGVKAIDLGLPSGTKWANMNVGATVPNESGLYFAWGETVGHAADDGHSFDWASYKWMTTDSISQWGINKYQVADNKTSGIWYVYDWDLVDYPTSSTSIRGTYSQVGPTLVSSGKVFALCSKTNNIINYLHRICIPAAWNISISNAKEQTGTFNPAQAIRQIFSIAEDLADFFWQFSEK